MLDQLIKATERELRVPTIIEDRCVHALMEQATCKACVAACPRGAWQLDDESLGIDTEACDGCGLCAPACSEAAITHDHAPAQRQLLAPAQRQWKNRSLVLCACERTELPDGEGVIPCIHALGARELLNLYVKGARELIVAAVDCDACDRGSVPRLTEAVGKLNRMLHSRDLPDITVRTVAASSWRRLTAELPHAAGGSSLGRRGFLRQAVGATVREGAKFTGLTDSQCDAFVPIGALLPRSAGEEIVPFAPVIDPERCNGCDACARLCPHEAIVLDETEQGHQSYRLNAESCTGCRICVDVCDQDAVTVQSWEPQRQSALALHTARCWACGVTFHIPDARPREDDLCPICTRVNHYRNLYQVLDRDPRESRDDGVCAAGAGDAVREQRLR